VKAVTGWYHSPDYQRVVQHRFKGASYRASIVGRLIVLVRSDTYFASFVPKLAHIPTPKHHKTRGNVEGAAMNRLEGRRALATGAARGIGRAIALALASEGADIAINYQTSENDAHSLVAEVTKPDRQTLLFKGDVGRISSSGTASIKRRDLSRLHC
jgi:short chain dehydrogenase